MRHTIFGAGLIGGYLGAALMANKASVGWVVRERVRKNLETGVCITDYLEHRYELDGLEFVDLESGSEEPDYLWLTVKCIALEPSIEDIRKLVKPNTTIICLQNGLGSEQLMADHFPDNLVVRGVMGANVVELRSGHLHRGTEGCIELFDCEQTRAFVSDFELDVLPLNLHENIEGLVWSKLQLNLNNAINALANIPLKAELSDQGYRKVLAAAQDELLMVAKKKGIVMPKITAIAPRLLPTMLRLPNWIYLRLAAKMLAIDPEARSSMWCDLEEGRRTEIDFLNGAIVKEGERLGLKCPVNAKLTAFVKQAESNEVQRGFSSSNLQIT